MFTAMKRMSVKSWRTRRKALPGLFAAAGPERSICDGEQG